MGLRAEVLRMFSACLMLRRPFIPSLLYLSLFDHVNVIKNCCCCEQLELNRLSKSVNWRDKLPCPQVFFLIISSVRVSINQKNQMFLEPSTFIYFGEFQWLWRWIYIYFIRLTIWHSAHYRDWWICTLWMSRSWAFVLWHKLSKKLSKAESRPHC